MIRFSSPTILVAFLPALALTLAAPAFAKTSVNKAEDLCKTAASQQQPAPKSVRVDKDLTQANNDSFVMTLRVKATDGANSKLVCTVDRAVDTASIAGLDGAALQAAR